MSYDPIADFTSGKRRAFTQSEHESINAGAYPGTRQLCSQCEQPTERCEDDSIYLDDGTGPLCPECYLSSDEYKSQPNLSA